MNYQVNNITPTKYYSMDYYEIETNVENNKKYKIN